MVDFPISGQSISYTQILYCFVSNVPSPNIVVSYVNAPLENDVIHTIWDGISDDLTLLVCTYCTADFLTNKNWSRSDWPRSLRRQQQVENCQRKMVLKFAIRRQKMAWFWNRVETRINHSAIVVAVMVVVVVLVTHRRTTGGHFVGNVRANNHSSCS